MFAFHVKFVFLSSYRYAPTCSSFINFVPSPHAVYSLIFQIISFLGLPSYRLWFYVVWKLVFIHSGPFLVFLLLYSWFLLLNVSLDGAITIFFLLSSSLILWISCLSRYERICISFYLRAIMCVGILYTVFSKCFNVL